MKRLFLLLLVCAATALVSGRAQAKDSTENLLLGASPIRVKSVRSPARLTDGRGAKPGDYWKTNLTARFDSVDSFVVYDLGEERKIGAVWLQGDSNDVYEIAGSRDGETFETIWQAPPSADAGMRARFASGLAAAARYLRISIVSGDGAFSVSEVQAFGESPSRFPPGVSEAAGAPIDRRVRDRVLLFGFVLIGALVFSYRGSPILWLSLLTLLVMVAGYAFVSAVNDARPLDNREISTVRATIALVAAIAILRESFFPPRFAAHRGIVLSTLALCGVTGFMAFYNLGQPQFWDQRRQTWTFVHYLDLRQYYPTAKYFPELGYRGMYEADVAAYVEDDHQSLDALRDLSMRDLADLQPSTVGNQRARVESVKSRFSPERWSSYKRDAAYFRQSMGAAQYLDTMNDMGGNATPVWMSVAHLLFSVVHAGNEAFLVTAVLDPLLLLAGFVAIGFVFGPRTALACMAIFGANDFIMYGSNWAGATLRHDWLSYIALGACALRRERFILAGSLFAVSASIRAFPALTLVGAALPALWWLVGYYRQEKKLPTLATVITEQRPTLRVFWGAAGTTAVLLAFSSIVLSSDAWGDWLSKVGQLSSDPHTNHISLRSLLAGWGSDQGRILKDRMPLFVGAILFYTTAVIIAARGKRLEHGAILGLMLMPVFFYPANYYIHFVCLLPLLVAERGESGRPAPLNALDGGVMITLFSLCAAQYMAVLVPDLALHFYLNGVLLFTACTVILLLLLREQAVTAGWFGSATERQETK